MPSLFSRIRHRKSASQSSASESSLPPSPRAPSARAQDGVPGQAQVQGHERTGSNNVRASMDTPRRSVDAESQLRSAAPGAGHGHGYTQAQDPNHGLLQRSEGDVVVIDKAGGRGSANANTSGYGTPTSQRERDQTGHSVPFQDESQRPDLPTTSSNVNNPIPVPAAPGSGSSSGFAPTTYLPNPDVSQEELARKPLPAVPESQSPMPRQELGSFPIPPEAQSGVTHIHGGLGHGDHTTGFNESVGGPFVPPRSPQRASISEASPQGHTQMRSLQAQSPPLPHVASVDRSALHQGEEERPALIPSSSHPAQSISSTNRYPHISSLPAVRGQHLGQTHYQETGRSSPTPRLDSEGNSRRSSRFVEVPQRGSSLKLRDDPEIQAFMSGDRDPSYDQGLSDQLADLSLRQPQQLQSQNQATSAAQGQQAAAKPTAVHFHPELQVQRDAFVSGLTKDTESRLGSGETLTEVGRDVFKKAGMERVLDSQNSVDMRSKVFDPVVKETIYPKVHTEYTTIITRCIHKTHYIPLIQPIHDPEPIVLATRHRIFSSADGKWHEVIGDAAAIEILGEDVFYNGPKETRELRKPALPGLEEMDEDAIRMAREAGIGSTGYSSGLVSGVGQSGGREFRHDEQIQVPIRGEKEDVAYDGIGRGGGSGRVLEREYKLGEEKSSKWQEIATYAGLENGLSGALGRKDAKEAAVERDVGVAL